MQTSLVVIISAIVIIITALVVLTMFGTGLAPTRSLTEAKSYCLSLGASSCAVINELPVNWWSPSVRVGGGAISCYTASEYLERCEQITGSGTSGVEENGRHTAIGVVEAGYVSGLEE